MDWQAILTSIDELVFQHTGKHLDNLQVSILKGVLNGQKYADIARQCKCSFGHVKDEGYQLWQVLSEALGEDINKSNFCATVERLGIANSHSSLINPVQIGHLELCNSSETSRSNQWGNVVNSDSESNFNSSQTKTISKLIQLGLTPEQIAEALDLPLDEVENIMET